MKTAAILRVEGCFKPIELQTKHSKIDREDTSPEEYPHVELVDDKHAINALKNIYPTFSNTKTNIYTIDLGYNARLTCDADYLLRLRRESTIVITNVAHNRIKSKFDKALNRTGEEISCKMIEGHTVNKV